MSYGHRITEARAAFVDLLNSRGPRPADPASLASRDLVISSLSAILEDAAGPAPRKRRPYIKTLENDLICTPVLVLRDRLRAATQQLDIPDPTGLLHTPAAHTAASWQQAAKYLLLAAADLHGDTSWKNHPTQQWAVVKDVTDLTRAVTTLEQHRPPDDTYHPLPNSSLIAVAATAARQQAYGGTLDHTVDTATRHPAPPSPSPREALGELDMVGALTSNRSTLGQLREIPSYRNLRRIIKTQADISTDAAQLLGTQVGNQRLAEYHEHRARHYNHMFRELRHVNGNLGRGTDAVQSSTHTAHALAHLCVATPITPTRRNQLAALSSTSHHIDNAISAAVSTGLNQGIYLVPAERIHDPVLRWRTVRGIKRAIPPHIAYPWVQATEAANIPIRNLATTLGDNTTNPIPIASPRRHTATRPPQDDLDDALAHVGNGRRPTRPNSR